MPRGDKSTYSDKQVRKAEHIEDSYEQRGVPEDEAQARAWATVNKQSGGGEKQGGSGQGKSPAAKHAARKDSAKRAVASKHGRSPNSGNAASKSGKLGDMKKTELQKLAAERQISGRSRMDKAALIKALSA